MPWHRLRWCGWVVQDGEFQAVGQGSGFFISADGLLVTNFHVIENAQFARVRLPNNATFFVDGVVATDQDNDLALLKVNGAELPFLPLDEHGPPKVGAKVYAIGNPQGLTNTFSEGITSAVRTEENGAVRIQTTAAISPGSSGGPLLGGDGKVVGVATAFYGGGQNLNIVVPTSYVRALSANRGELVALASAGAKPIDAEGTAKLNSVWVAIGEKDFRKAMSLLAELRSELQENPMCWFCIGYLHDEMGNYDLAVDAHKAAIAIKPDYADAYYNMGVSLANLGRREEAIAAYKAAIAIKQDFATAYLDMSIDLHNLGRREEAVTAWRRAISLDPHGPVGKGAAKGLEIMGVR